MPRISRRARSSPSRSRSQQAPEGGEPFPDVPLGFTPYRHQRTAFSRLAASAGRSTVVATGTGSGKTECFLYPILDHCRERAGTAGIKAIVIYPMNALAADQARRIGETIDRTPALRGKVTAGVFVGRDNQPQRSAHKAMGRDHVVTDRDTLREQPPDILLTNYKMLDYLLVRPFDFRLWRYNGTGHAALPGGRRAAHVRRRAGNRPCVPPPPSTGAARRFEREADLRRVLGHPR